MSEISLGLGVSCQDLVAPDLSLDYALALKSGKLTMWSWLIQIICRMTRDEDLSFPS